MKRLLLLGTVLSLLVLTQAPVASAGGRHHRPDLTVPGGSVVATGSTLTGSFTIRARPGARVGRSVARLSLVGGPDLATYRVKRLRPGKARTLTVAATLPAGVPDGTWTARVCADARGKVKERSEKNNCRDVGTVVVGPVSSVPTRPIPFTAGTPFAVSGAGASYWAVVPTSYDASHQTPTKLLVWMHGCGGEAEGDASTISPGGAQDWISLSLGGRDGDCWDVGTDTTTVLAALADVKTHFNVDPRRVVIGGYSSGGDLAYRTAFFHATSFAGLIAENTSPFRDTGSTQSASLAAAAWRFNVVHLAHTGDDVYPIAGVRAETDAMTAAGFPVTRIERPGAHYDAMTDTDLQTYLLPALAAGWLAPAG